MKCSYVLVLSIAFLTLFSCTHRASNIPSSPTIVSGQSETLARFNLIKKVEITTDTEGGSARPEVAVYGDKAFVVYLGNISKGQDRFFGLKIYDRDLNQVIVSKRLVSSTAQFGSPTDIRIASDGQYLFTFYETNKANPTGNSTTYLWGAKYTLDDNFNRVAYTETPIVSSQPMAELQNGGELLDDPAPLVGPDSVFVVTRLKYPLTINGDTIYRVREFDKEFRQMLRQFDLNLSSVVDGRARVCSLFFNDNTIYLAVATTVSDKGAIDNNDDGAQSDIVLIRLKADWSLDTQQGVQVLSAESNDRENYVSGFITSNGTFYLTYKQAVGIPPTGEQRAWIKVFDKDFKMIGSETVKTTIWGPSGGEIRPSLAIDGDRVISGQSSGQGLGKGNAEIYIYSISK